MMNKPKILMLILEYAPIFSGHAIYLQMLLPYIKENGYNVEILSGDFLRYPSEEIIDSFKIHRFPFNPQEKRWELLLTLRVLRFLFQHRNEFDILHFHGHMDYYGLLTLFCKCFRKKIIMQMVLLGADDPESLMSQYGFMYYRLKILSYIDRFIHISRPIGDCCLRAGFSVSKLRYIPQGVDINKFSPVTIDKKLQIRSRLGINQKCLMACFVGAIVQRKGVDLLIDAWRDVQIAFPDAELVLVGPCEFSKDDANEKILQAFVEEIKCKILQFDLKVNMVGRSSEVQSYLQASDIFVLPSRNEGFGNVIIEAMSCGVPPIVTYMDGVSMESVTQGETGYIIQSVEELATVIHKLFEDEELRRKMGAKAREDVIRRFAFEHISQKYTSLYDELSK